MPIIKTEGGYIYKKTTKNTGFGKSKFFFILFLCSILIIAGSFYVLTKFNIVGALNLNKYLVFSAKTYYAVCVDESDNYSDISETCQNVKLQNGSGYVLNLNDKYYVVANCYLQKEDANSVANGIATYNAKVIEINFSKLVISTNFSSEQITVLKASLNLVNMAFENLYNISLKLDSGEILDAEARQKLQVFKDLCQEDKETLNKTFQNNLETIVTRVKIYYSQVISNISMLLISKNLNSDIKYSMTSILDEFSNLQKAIKK